MKTTSQIAQQLRTENANLSWAAAMKQAHAILRAEAAANGDIFTSANAANAALKEVKTAQDMRNFIARLGQKFAFVTRRSGSVATRFEFFDFDNSFWAFHPKGKSAVFCHLASRFFMAVEIEQA